MPVWPFRCFLLPTNDFSTKVKQKIYPKYFCCPMRINRLLFSSLLEGPGHQSYGIVISSLTKLFVMVNGVFYLKVLEALWPRAVSGNVSFSE